MIPGQLDTSLNLNSNEILPFKTYKMDFEQGRIIGVITDGVEAVKQYIKKTLLTERFKYLIYDDQYGSEIEMLKTLELSEEAKKVELENAITDALSDKRIQKLDNFVFKFEGEATYVSFNTYTIYGVIPISEVL